MLRIGGGEKMMNWFRNLNIGKKLAVGFMILVIVAGIIENRKQRPLNAAHQG